MFTSDWALSVPDQSSQSPMAAFRSPSVGVPSDADQVRVPDHPTRRRTTDARHTGHCPPTHPRNQMKILQHATSYPPRLRRAGRRLVAIAVTALVVSAIVLGTSTASAQTAPVTDYGAYPPSLPAGCPDGPDLLDGLRWATSAGGNSSDLATLGRRPGDTVTASWSAFDPGCTQTDGAAAIIVSLAAYEGGATPFDPRVDQRLVEGWASCGAGAASCQRAGDGYHLAVSLPGGDTCAAQLDLVIGRPLAVVGPGGSYFSKVARNDSGPNNLIASGSLAANPCTAPAPAAPAAEQPDATVLAGTTPPTATPATTTPATEAAVITPAAAPTTTAPAPTTAPPAVSAEALAISPAELPITGLRHSPDGHHRRNRCHRRRRTHRREPTPPARPMNRHTLAGADVPLAPRV